MKMTRVRNILTMGMAGAGLAVAVIVAAGVGMLLRPGHTQAATLATGSQPVQLSIDKYLSVASWTVSPSGTGAFSLKNSNHPSQTVTIGATLTCNYTSTVSIALTTTPGGFTIGTLTVNTATVGPITSHNYTNLATFVVTQPGEGQGTTNTYDVSMAAGVVTVHSEKAGTTNGVVTVTFSG
jgi:hypothetical protein